MIIELKGLSYRYPTGKKDVLHDLTAAIEQGSVTAIIGANGSGKTTLCNVVRGFIPHFYHGDLRGEVLVHGKDIREWNMSGLAEKIGYVFQNPFTQMSGIKETVAEEIAFGLENLGVEETKMKERVWEVVRLLQIESLIEKNPFELSGGQKQRVALASIIAMEPEILIMDEPTSQLDPQGTEDIFAIIQLMKQQGKTILLVEHKIEMIAEIADRVIVLQGGELVMQGNTKEVLSDERVLLHGAALPQYALFGIEMRKRNMGLQQIPVTEREAVAELGRWLDARRRS